VLALSCRNTGKSSFPNNKECVKNSLPACTHRVCLRYTFSLSNMKHQGDENMPLVKVKEKFQVTIPTALRKAVRLSVGDLLEAEAKGNATVLKPKVVVDREAVDAAIKEGLADLKAGRVTPKFSSIKEFKSYRRNR
jgi:AbrB family looped-hinge helix DNA binding protein